MRCSYLEGIFVLEVVYVVVSIVVGTCGADGCFVLIVSIVQERKLGPSFLRCAGLIVLPKTAHVCGANEHDWRKSFPENDEL